MAKCEWLWGNDVIDGIPCCTFNLVVDGKVIFADAILPAQVAQIASTMLMCAMAADASKAGEILQASIAALAGPRNVQRPRPALRLVPINDEGGGP